MRKYLILCLFLAQPSWALFGFVQSKTCSAFAATVNCAYTTNPLAHDLLISACSAGGVAAATTLSDNNTNTYANTGDVVEGNAGNNVLHNNIYYVIDSHVGATTVTCASVGASFVTVAIHEYSGLSTTAPFDVTSSSAPVALLATFGSTAATTTTSNELMFGVLFANNGTLSSQNGTLRENNLNNILTITEEATVASPGVYASSVTLTAAANPGVMMQAAFKLPAVGGGFNKVKRLERYE